MNKNIDITKEYKKYIVPKSNESMEAYCYPKKFTLQSQQLFLADFLSNKHSPWKIYDHIRGILIYHQIGSGKTCTSITIAERFKTTYKIIIVLPASLINNFKDELQSLCTGEEYITNDERKKLENLDENNILYKKILEKVNKKINKYYTIYSYHKFINLIETNKLKNLNDSLLIIDEIQNMISLDGIFYKNLKNIIRSSNKNLKLLLLSATPMFDKPIEIALTLNLLTINDIFDIESFNNTYVKRLTKNVYKIKNVDEFKEKIKYLISYYRGAPPQAYPKTNFKISKCLMNDFQYKGYLLSLRETTKNESLENTDIMSIPKNFFLGPRMMSNVVFPNKQIGEKGANSFKGEHLQLQNICTYSIKFYKILTRLNKSDGPCFVYSNFKNFGGIAGFIKFIEYHKWKNYKTNDIGSKRFAIWSSDESDEYKKKIKSVFNNKNNIYGDDIKLIIGSPSIKEGVTLLRVRQVHIMEPYWNISRLTQIMGRAIRFCSHKDVEKNRRQVDVYLYLAVSDKSRTIDKYIWSLAKKKYNLISQFEHALKESAFDCNIFFNRNSFKTDELPLKCIK
jgi:hypothetical protein